VSSIDGAAPSRSGLRRRTNAPPEATGDDGRRVLSRHRPLPGGRAVVGGLLIAVAVVGIFAAYTSSNARPRQLYVVAARDLPAGTRLTDADLSVAALDVPDAGLRKVLFGPGAMLTSRGATTIAPLSAGELVQASAVVGRAGGPGSREVSIQIDRARAVGGTLKTGEYVDVLGTFGTGADAYTVTMVAHVRVISIGSVTSALGDDSTSQILTLAADDQRTAEALADANVAAQMTLVRSADPSPGPGRVTGIGTDGTDGAAPQSYRAPGPPAAGSAG
jgi:Flp pilus assembly protein CpaB